jgi:phosphotriesterase-related protein
LSRLQAIVLGMDRFGADSILSMEKRISTVTELCRCGWASHMVLSHDRCCHIDWLPKETIRALAPHSSLRHIPDDVLPMLHQAGVDDEQVTAMTVTNPARVFGG